MAVWSEVNYTEAKREGRFGAEFWKPESLEPLRKDRNWHLIGDLLTSVQYGISREMSEEPVGLPIYRMNEMDGLFLSIPEKYVTLKSGEYDAFSLAVGDVLFNRTNSFKYVGRTGILKEPIRAVFASYLIRLVTDTEKLLPEYLTVYLNTPTGIGQVKRRAMESINQANVSGSEIRRVPIPLMPMSFQCAIAKIVDEAAEKRIKARELYAQAQTLLLSELGLGDVDLSPTLFYEREYSEAREAARLDAEFFQPKYDRAVNMLSTKRYKPLCDVASIRKGRQASVSDEDEGRPYASIKDISGFLIEPDGYTTDTGLVFLEPGNLALAITGATIGKVGINASPHSIAICGDLLTIGSDEIPFGFLQAVMGSPMIQCLCEKHTSGATNGHLAPRDVASFPIPILSTSSMMAVHVSVTKAITARDESRHLMDEAKRLVEEAVLGEKP